MKHFLILWRRELRACFLSPVAYVTLVVFLIVSGVTFVGQVVRSVGTDEPLSIQLYASILFWLTMLITVICMRLFAEERRTGTIETLLTAPVTDVEVVMGKYAGALSFVWLALTLAATGIVLLDAVSPGITSLDWGAILSGYVIMVLLSAFCVSVGLVVSLMTRKQIVAAICGFCAIWVVLLAGWTMASAPFGLKALGDSVSALAHIEAFSRGIVDTRPIVFYIAGTSFMLFVGTRVLESRRWR